VIVSPKTPQEWQAMSQFLLQYAFVHPSADLKMIGWVEGNSLAICVGLNGFMGKVCQMHVAMRPDFRFSPRLMLREVFRYAFNDCEREMVLGVVNSKNEEALRYDLHLGFKVMYALPKLHDDGGDIVLLGMTKDECRWLNMPATPQEAAQVTH
jgi:hypothetical protein